MASKRKRLTCDDYHVAWICAVANLEQLPARLMLDEEHDTLQYNAHYDENTYTCGSINGHAVVIATCPQGKTGNVHAARLTGSLYKTFRNINMTVLVGIGGGIPKPVISEDALKNLHLGDVVVGWPGDGKPACVYYDSGRDKAGEPFEMVGTLPDPHWRLIAALGVLTTDHELRRTTFDEQLLRLKGHGSKFDYPGVEHDKLFEATYRHIGDYTTRCKECNQSEIIERPRRSAKDQRTLAFHQGRIATGNAVVQDGVKRDEISARCDGALCVEMEAAGVNVNGPCLSIRGISDYADSHKSDLWRFHAAGKAAAFARELLCRMQPAPPAQHTQPASQPVVSKEAEVATEAPWLVPLPRPSFYVGRKDKLVELRTHISSQSCRKLAVYGLGGCGKTALALEAAYQTREQQPTRAIFWVPAVSRTTFEQAYRDIAEALSISGTVDAKSDVKKLVKARLSDERFGPWLMIIDNADDVNILFDPVDEGDGMDGLIDYLPYSRKGSIIFTTRTRKAAVDLAQDDLVELDKLSQNEARDLLRTRLPSKYQHQIKDDAIVDEFIDMLAFLALAIVQAVAFIKKNGTKLSDYIRSFKASKKDATYLLNKEFTDQGRHRETKNPVATTWCISFEQIRDTDKLAADYLSFMACMANNDIPSSMLPTSDSLVERAEAIGTLEAYAFIQRQEGTSVGHQTQSKQTETFSIHPLVHLATRSWLEKRNQWDVWAAKAITRMIELVPFGDYQTREIWTPYLPHAIYVSNLAVNRHTDSWMELLSGIAYCQKTLGQYKPMERTLRDLLEWEEETLGKKHENTLQSLHLIGQALFGQGRYTEAEQMHRQTLALREEVLGKEHSDTLASMNELALALRNQGRYKEAEQIHREQLVLREKVSGQEDQKTLASMGNLATVLAAQGKYKEAEQLHRKELSLMEKVCGKGNPETLTSMNSLALTLQRQGKYVEAKDMYRRTLALREEVLGIEHPNTLVSMNNLAEVLRGQKKYKEAEEMHRRTLTLREGVLGMEHPNTLSSMNNLAEVLRGQKKYKEAEKMHRSTLALREEVLGMEHPDTLSSMNNLAAVLYHQKRYEEAEEMHRRTLALREEVLGMEHPDTLISVHWVGGILRRQEKYEDALPFYERAYKGYVEVLGSDHPYTQGCASWYSHVKYMVERRTSDPSDSSSLEEGYEHSNGSLEPEQVETHVDTDNDVAAQEEDNGEISDSESSVGGGVSL